MQPWAPEMHSKAQKGFITKAELSCRIEYVRGTSHKAAEYSLFLIVYFFSKASLLSELLGVQSGENANGDLQKCKMCSWFWARRAFKPIQMRSRPSTSRHGADKSAALWEKKRWWSWWRCWWWWTWMDVWLAIAGLALQVWHHLRNRQIPNHQRLRRSSKWWGGGWHEYGYWWWIIGHRVFVNLSCPGISLCQQKQQKKSFWPDSLVSVLPFPNNCQQLKILLPYKRLLTKWTVRHLQLHHSNSRHSPLASHHRQQDQIMSYYLLPVGWQLKASQQEIEEEDEAFWLRTRNLSLTQRSARHSNVNLESSQCQFPVNFMIIAVNLLVLLLQWAVNSCHPAMGLTCICWHSPFSQILPDITLVLFTNCLILCLLTTPSLCHFSLPPIFFIDGS